MLPWAVMMLVAADPGSASRTITVDSAQVTLIEQVKVPAQEAGVLAALRVREGDRVNVDQELGSIESGREQLAKAQAVLELEMAEELAASDVEVRLAQKTCDVSKAELKRSLESVVRFPKSISQTELDRLRLTAERAELETEKADRDLKIARLDRDLRTKKVEAAALEINRRSIRAPIAGTVVEILRQPGEWVAPGDPVLRILRLDKLRVEAFLSADKISSQLSGARVTLDVEVPQQGVQAFVGEIVFVDPEIEPVTGQFRIWAEVKNRDLLLGPGRHGSLRIELPDRASHPPDAAVAEPDLD